MENLHFTVRDLEPALFLAGIAVRYFNKYRSPDWSMHGHDIVEMNFVINGTAEHRLEDTVTRIQPGMLGVVHYGQTHGYRTGKTGMDLYNIYIDPQNHPLPEISAELRPYLARFLPLHHQLAHQQNRVVHLQFPDTKNVEMILANMARESDRLTIGSREALRAGYQLFLIECARLLKKQAPVSAPEQSPTEHSMEELRSHLDRTFTQPLTLADLAGHTGMAPNYLCRVFKKYTGKTIVQYLTQRRIEAALLRLASTSDKVLSIAYECGFGDLAHFNRTFKKLTGTSPNRYRQQLGKNAAG